MNFDEYLRLTESTCSAQPIDKDDLIRLIKDAIKREGKDCDLNFIDTSLITDMSHLFEGSPFNGDISKWDTSNVTNMAFMFERSKFNGDISKWNTSNVKYMNGMFQDSAFNGDISKWDVSNVRNMEYMFTKSKFDDIRILSKWSPRKDAKRRNVFNDSLLNGKRFKHVK